LPGGPPPGASGPGRVGNAAALPAAAPVFTAPQQQVQPRAATPSIARDVVTPAQEPVAVAATPARAAAIEPSSGANAAASPAVNPDVRVTAEAFALPAGTPQPIPFRQQSGLLSFTTPPFIEGDFIAALRQPDGTWIALVPRAEPFPNRWQQRVMLWFALSLLIVAPIAWLFARRIVKPLESFAQAAESLGRDPSATVMPLSGPAEIGRAAQAFNQMNSRLRAFVDDRTAMVGAISHDLRTPLTRLRFRIEDVPDAQRDALLREVEEMEVMISQVIAFIRDASTPGPRERVDFAELVESSVEDARLLGSVIELEAESRIPVDVDPVGMRRLLGNLLENALKYGTRTRVRVALRGEQAVAEVIDDGPGIPADERDQAFEPFYRGDNARRSDKPGSGLGLAVCRSIARAHGGEVSLEQRDEGFVAAVSVPISYVDVVRIAA
jgi:signal transduction histidine kinase